MTYVARSNMFKTRESVDQVGEGAAAERCAQSARSTHRVVESGPKALSQVWYVTPASLSVPRGGCATSPSGGIRRSRGSNHAQAPPADSAGATLMCETRRPDDGRDRQPGAASVSRHAKKAWLSSVQNAARFKSISNIRLTVCSHRSLCRPMRSWCLAASLVPA